MAITVGDAIVYYRGDNTDALATMKKTEQSTKSWAGRVGKYVSETLSTATGVMLAKAVLRIGSALANVGPQLIGLGSDAEEMMGKFNVVFGEFAEGTIASLDDLATEMGRSKFEMREFAASFQDSFVPMGFARGEAAKLSEQLVELTYDVASFNNTLESDTARDFQSAIIGNHETVRKYGIIISEVTLNQELLNMGITGGTKAATEQQKVTARLNMIMAGTSDAQGDAVRTGGSWANQLRAVKAAVTDLATGMGTKLLPVFTPLLSQIREFVQIRGPQMVEAVEGLFLGPVAAAAKAAGELFTFLSDGVIELARLRAGIVETAEVQLFGGDTEAAMTFQLELLRELVLQQGNLAAATKDLTAEEEEAVKQITGMYYAYQTLTPAEERSIIAKEQLAYNTGEQSREIEKLIRMLSRENKAKYYAAIAQEDLNRVWAQGNSLHEVAAKKWAEMREEISRTAEALRDAAASYATPIGMYSPVSDEEKLERFLWAGKWAGKEKELRERNDADARKEAEDYWKEYERLGKEAWGKIQGLISGSFKQTEDWIRVALMGTSADVGDAWDEMARRAEAVINDMFDKEGKQKKGATSPWLKMFDVPEDILRAGGDQLKAFMTKLAADIRESPTVKELGDVGIEAMVKNIKKSLTDELGLADLEQTVALKLASDPEAVAMMNQLGIDVDAAMNNNKDAVVASIQDLKDSTLTTITTNFPDLLTKDGETSLLGNIVSAIKGLYERELSVSVTNWNDAGAQAGEFGGLPNMAVGGTVPGAPGEPVPIMAHGQERIIPYDQEETARETRVYITTLNLMGVQDVSSFLAELEALT